MAYKLLGTEFETCSSCEKVVTMEIWRNTKKDGSGDFVVRCREGQHAVYDLSVDKFAEYGDEMKQYHVTHILVSPN